MTKSFSLFRSCKMKHLYINSLNHCGIYFRLSEPLFTFIIDYIHFFPCNKYMPENIWKGMKEIILD